MHQQEIENLKAIIATQTALLDMNTTLLSSLKMHIEIVRHDVIENEKKLHTLIEKQKHNVINSGEGLLQ